MMTFSSIRPALLLVLLIILATAHSSAALSSELASNANIFLYSRPVKVADLLMKNTAGQTVSLSDYKGKVILLHFWSIRCPACRTEEPLLDSLKKTFGSAGLEILGVNLIDPPTTVAHHAVKTGAPFSILFGGGHGFTLEAINTGGKRTAFVVNPAREAILEIPALPTTYIIDCRGDAVGYSVGAAQWNHRAAVDLIQNLIAQSRTCQIDSSPSYQTPDSMHRTLF